jgi:transcriptional regulator with XRE-family HTH domain
MWLMSANPWYLRDYRESAGYDLAEAARVLKCNRSKISRIETGQRGIPRRNCANCWPGTVQTLRWWKHWRH